MPMHKLSEIASRRELFANLTLRELRSKYKRSALGWLWSLINPLVAMGIYTLVFSFYLRIEPPVGDPSGLDLFAFYLLAGLLPFTFLSNSLNAAMAVLISNTSLVTKVYFPREILVAATTASWLVSFLIELSLFSIALLFVGNVVFPWIPMILVIVALQTLFVLGVGMMLAVWTVYFRDLQHLVPLALQVLFFSAPIIVPVTVIADRLRDITWAWWIYNLNPLTRFVEAYHDLFYNLRMPPATHLAYLVVVSVATLILGYKVFGRFDGRLAEEL